jgi:hypothetical protein
MQICHVVAQLAAVSQLPHVLRHRHTGLAEERTESIDCNARNGRKTLSKRAELLVMQKSWKL